MFQGSWQIASRCCSESLTPHTRWVSSSLPLHGPSSRADVSIGCHRNTIHGRCKDRVNSFNRRKVGTIHAKFDSE